MMMAHSGCGYSGPATHDGQCPECKHQIIAETLHEGQLYDCVFITGAHLGKVELVKLEKNSDDRYNGLALVWPLRVRIGHHCGEPVYRDGTAKDITHVGTMTLRL